MDHAEQLLERLEALPLHPNIRRAIVHLVSTTPDEQLDELETGVMDDLVYLDKAYALLIEAEYAEHVCTWFTMAPEHEDEERASLRMCFAPTDANRMPLMSDVEGEGRIAKRIEFSIGRIVVEDVQRPLVFLVGRSKVFTYVVDAVSSHVDDGEFWRSWVEGNLAVLSAYSEVLPRQLIAWKQALLAQVIEVSGEHWTRYVRDQFRSLRKFVSTVSRLAFEMYGEVPELSSEVSTFFGSRTTTMVTTLQFSTSQLVVRWVPHVELFEVNNRFYERLEGLSPTEAMTLVANLLGRSVPEMV